MNDDIGANGPAGTAPAGPGLPPLPLTARLPGRRQLIGWCGGSLAFCGVLVPVALASHVPGAIVLLLIPAVILGLGVPLRRVRLHSLLSDRRYRTLACGPAAGALATALKPAGIREVVLRVGPVRGLARNFRAGDRAVLLCHDDLIGRPELSEFFLAHEAAHLARHDAARRPVVFTSALAGWCCLVLAWPPAVVALPLLIVAAGAFNHAMELDCDRLAVSWVGPGPAERALLILKVARERVRLTRVQTIRSRLTYPLPERRLDAVRPAAGPVPPDAAPS